MGSQFSGCGRSPFFASFFSLFSYVVEIPGSLSLLIFILWVDYMKNLLKPSGTLKKNKTRISEIKGSPKGSWTVQGELGGLSVGRDQGPHPRGAPAGKRQVEQVWSDEASCLLASNPGPQ